MTSLRQRMIEDMKVRNFAKNTQDSYIQRVSMFARHFGRSPETISPEEIRSYQLYLTTEKKLAPGTIGTTIAALRFLYSVTLQKQWVLEQVIPMPKIPDTLPVVLSPDEVLEFPGVRAPYQASDDSDSLLWCGVADIGSRASETHRHR